jgi:hypothetical protein
MSPAADKMVSYQKPTCSKCMSATKVLRDRGVDFEALNHRSPTSTERTDSKFREFGEFRESGEWREWECGVV